MTEKDDGKVRISWRGDGQMFCVSFVTRENPRFRLLVLSRSSVLYSTSENCPGLEYSLAWRPSGNIIATTVVKPNKHVVAFFEKNGLQHSEFSLRKVAEVLEVEWNSDSSVLLVLTKIGTDHELEFWTVGNYHWYLKQCLPLKVLVIQLRCYQEDPQLLQFLQKTEGGGVKLRSYRLAGTTNASAGLEDTDLAVVGVVDDL